MPWIAPVSWTGKNPLGIAMYRTMVSTSVAIATRSVAPCRSSTHVSMRAYPAITRSNHSPVFLNTGPCSCTGMWRSRRAHIIGVSVSETAAESRMATASVIANSRNSRPTTSPMNRSGISTAMSDTVREMMVKPISFAPFSAAASGASPFSM